MSLLAVGCGSSKSAGGTDVVEPDLPEGVLGVRVLVDRTRGNAPLTVHLDVQVEGCAEEETDFLWTAGPGVTSGEKAPSFVLTASGNTTISLEATCRRDGARGHDSVSIAVLEPAELSVGKVTLSPPTTLAPGDDVKFNFEMRNRGDRVEDPFRIDLVLSRDEQYQPSTDIVLKSLEVDGMADGRTVEEHRTWLNELASLPADLPEGVYFLFVVVDAAGVVNEGDENDNVGKATSFITVEASAKDRPDLTVEPPELPSGATVKVGKGLGFSIRLGNQGKKEAKQFRYAVFASQDDQWSPDDVKLTDDASSTIFELAAGKSLTLTSTLRAPATLAPGTWHVVAVVDPQDVVAEESEDNNVAAAAGTLEVVPDVLDGFDLVLKELVVSPHDTYWGGSLKITLRVSNPGTKSSPSWPVALFLSAEPSLNPNYDTRIADLAFDPIPPGGEVTVSKVVTIPAGSALKPGDYYLSAVVDVAMTLDELDATNNWKQDPVPVHVFKDAYMDLALSKLAVHPSELAVGDTLKVAWTMRNLGSTSTGGFYAVIALARTASAPASGLKDGTLVPLRSVAVDGIPPSGTVDRVEEIVVPAALPRDNETWWVAVLGDPDRQLTKDTDRLNQTLLTDMPVTIRGGQGGCLEDAFEPDDDPDHAVQLDPGMHPDLGSCGNEDWYQAALSEGQSLIVDLASKAPLWLVPKPSALGVDLVGPDGKTATRVATGADVLRASALAVTQAGTWKVRVYPAAKGNQAQYSLTVAVRDPGEGIDLIPASVDVAPLGTYPGGLLFVGVPVANLGTADAAASTAEVWLSTDGTPSGDDRMLGTLEVPAVPGGGRADAKGAVRVPADAAAGTYAVLVVLDPDGALGQTDRTNDLASSAPVAVDTGMTCEDDPFEPNDAAVAATVLPAATATVPGLNVCPDLPDWYRFEVPQGVLFQVAASYPYKSGQGYLAMDLLDAGGQAILDAAATSEKPVVGLPYVFTGGTWYVRVRSNPAGGKAGPWTYSLAVTVSDPLPGDVCVADAREPDNGFDEAAGLGCGANRLTLCRKDRDVYRVNLAQGQPLSAALLQAKGEFRMSLFDDPAADPRKVLSGNGKVDWTPSAPGPVWLLVEARNASAVPSDFAYTLTMDGVPGTDIGLGGLSAFPGEVIQGEDVRLSFVLGNACGEAAPAAKYAVYLSDSPVPGPGMRLLGSGNLPAVPARGQVPVTAKVLVPADVAPGVHHLVVVADPEGLVVESQEDDNAAATPVTVVAACGNDDLEPNDGPGYAPSLVPGTYDLAICPYDVDWFRVATPAGGRLTVRLLAPYAAGDLDLRLYGPADLEAPLAVGSTDHDVEQVAWTSASAQELFVRVNGFMEASAPYRLVVALE